MTSRYTNMYNEIKVCMRQKTCYKICYSFGGLVPQKAAKILLDAKEKVAHVAPLVRHWQAWHSPGGLGIYILWDMIWSLRCSIINKLLLTPVWKRERHKICFAWLPLFLVLFELCWFSSYQTNTARSGLGKWYAQDPHWDSTYCLSVCLKDMVGEGSKARTN